MMVPRLEDLVRMQFPHAQVHDGDDLGVGSFADWTSLAHFNFLLLVEESYGIRFSVDEISEIKSIHEIRSRLAAAGINA